MRLCLMIEGQEDVTWDDWVALGEACESSGLEGLFRSDHYLSGDGRIGRGSLDAWTTLAAIAGRTERIRLGTMVSPATFRHPSVLANAAVTVDHISGGRAELGLGAGWYELEHRAFGFPFPPLGERMELLEEQLEIVHRQWTEAEFSFGGRHYQLDGCPALPKPVQRPHPPLIVGGAGKPRTVEAAARWADEYNVVGPTPEQSGELRRSLDAAAERHGRRPPVLSVMTTCLVGEDADAVARRADALAPAYSAASGRELLQEHGKTWIAGTVDEAAAQLQRLAEAGVERVMLQHLLHRDVEMVELLGRELAPQVGTRAR
ncbi:MAG: TIGR03560 family F420-dependent LLM class oxidoreductase [Gaiellales bacterium]